MTITITTAVLIIIYITGCIFSGYIVISEWIKAPPKGFGETFAHIFLIFCSWLFFLLFTTSD